MSVTVFTLMACTGSVNESTTTSTNTCAEFIDEWGLSLQEAGELHKAGLEAIGQWGEGVISKEEVVKIMDETYLAYFSLGEELMNMGSPPIGFERPPELLLDAVGHLFQGYGNGWRAVDGDEIDDEQLQLADHELGEGGELLIDAAQAVLDSTVDPACAEALSRVPATAP